MAFVTTFSSCEGLFATFSLTHGGGGGGVSPCRGPFTIFHVVVFFVLMLGCFEGLPPPPLSEISAASM